MTTTKGASAPILIPTSINWIYCRGVLIEYEASDAELIACGIATPEQMPDKRYRCSKKITYETRFRRLKDGRVRAVIPADTALLLDTGYRRFIGGLLSDTRLSLVKGEKA